MTNPTGNFINSTSETEPDFKIFPFLKKRYTSGFFNQFVNDYFLFLLEDCNRFKWDAADHFDKTLEAVFNPVLLDEKCYTNYFLHSFIYGGPQNKQSNELSIMDSADLFLLSCKYNCLNQLKFEKEQIKNELLRLAGLLIIHIREDFSKPSRPEFFTTTKNGVGFFEPWIIRNSLLQYKKECANALARLDAGTPFGRIYTPIADEYFGFLEFAIGNCKKLLTQELREVLDKWHRHFKQGKIEIEPEVGQVLQFMTGPLKYLQGRPSGSARKK